MSSGICDRASQQLAKFILVPNMLLQTGSLSLDIESRNSRSEFASNAGAEIDTSAEGRTGAVAFSLSGSEKIFEFVMDGCEGRDRAWTKTSVYIKAIVLDKTAENIINT